jgi:four helix bundle protein
MEKFGYEKLDVYRCSMEFLESAFALIDMLPKGFAHLGDQLKRASLSIPLNIAEGSGKASSAERRRFYEIARASALESSAIVNCASTLNIVDSNLALKNRILILRIVQMLSKLTARNRIR